MDLANLDWHDLYVCNNINTKVDIFNCKVLSLMDKHCPMITFVEGKPKPPWLTPLLKKNNFVILKTIMVANNIISI